MKIKLESINKEVTPEEAKELYEELKSHFEEIKYQRVIWVDPPYVPQYPQYPQWPGPYYGPQCIEPSTCEVLS